MERLAGAMVSDDLSVVDRKRGDADHMAALGAVMQRRPDGLSAMLRFALVGDKVSFGQVVRYARGITRNLSIKRGWKLKLSDIDRIARKAVEYHYSPSCTTCNGTGKQEIKGTPVLSATNCPHCHGTGKRPMPLRNGRQIAEVIWSMDDGFRVIENSVKRKLG